MINTPKINKSPKSEEKKYYEINSISKASQMLEILSTQKSWELGALSKAMGLPKSTTHRIVLTLKDNGYIVQEKGSSNYMLSYKLFSIGSRVLKNSSVVDVARPFCRELLKRIDETVNLCVVYGSQMLVVDRLVSSKPLRQDTSIGEMFPLLQSASGKIFLALGDEAEVADALQTTKDETNPQFVDELLASMYDELQAVKETWLAYDAEEVFQGVRCIAAPIFNYQSKVVSTLSVSVPTVRMTEASVTRIELNLSDITQQISAHLGFTSTRR